MAAARITSFLVKLASRCNLDCDYCYVYHHADQSWRRMPRTLSDQHQTAFAQRLAAYVREQNLNECYVVFHGGEPLLAGAERIAAFAREISETIGESAKVRFGMQTNGLLLTDAALDALEAANVIVSLSLDGPREVNDLHRTTRKHRSSFDRVASALERLQKRPETFAGVIAVIDPRVQPETLFSYFSQFPVPNLDFLLPDAHHLRPPPGRTEQPTLYRDWLVRAFNLWFDQYPHLRVRFFETLLDSAAGLPSQTDAIGFGDVSLLTIETDGTYHDLDVLKVVEKACRRSQAASPIGKFPMWQLRRQSKRTAGCFLKRGFAKPAARAALWTFAVAAPSHTGTGRRALIIRRSTAMNFSPSFSTSQND
ncbi:MAG: FxsB family cyclophane-forming radical SAM/SPASM peptide maturase [Terricaulis sp.]